MQLNELIYTSNDDFEISQKIKKAIEEYLNQTKIEGGKDFFVKHTKQMDFFIALIYKYILKKSFNEYRPPMNNIPITLIALGSYGREQLSIYSDIDIMIVYKETPGYNLKETISNFITMLWDLGLKIGHRVHKIEDLFPASNEDITIKTAILESRFITGSKFLWYKTENELNKIRTHNIKEYILVKYEEMQNRHKKFPISMEPNIKDGFGGIRDSNNLYWMTKVIFNYPTTKYLTPKYASEEEYKEYRVALEFLFKTRVYLHLVARKKTDKVYIEYQRDIALKMGYTDSARLKAERKFIKDLLKSLWTVNTFCEINIKNIIKKYLYSHPYKEMKNKRVSKNLCLCECVLYSNFKTDQKFEEYIKNILNTKEEFYKCVISVVNNLKKKKYRMHKNTIKKLFYFKNLYPLFFALYRAGKLQKIIPDFGKIKYLAQFDGYHQYPVDIHSLYTLKEIEKVDMFKSLSNDEKAILRFTAFYHDLGKGRREEHSVVGAKLAKNFALKIGLQKTKIIEKLIKHHTLMSNTAQREDIYNDKVILSFAQTVENEKFLKYLYILTIADIKAVGKNIFTSYKANLLQTLYKNTLNALQNRELLSEMGHRKRKEKILQNKEEFKTLPLKIRKAVLKSPSNQLFLQNSIQNIIKTAEWIKDVEEFKVKFENTKHLCIHLAKKDHLNFAIGWFLEKLQHLNLNHLSIYKIGDVKYFKIEFEEKVEDYDLETIKEFIQNAFGKKEIYTKVKFSKKDFEIDCNHSQNYASVKLKKADKKGIISTIMNTFDKFSISVEDVKISTQKKTARDLFIIPKDSGFCDKKEEILKALT